MTASYKQWTDFLIEQGIDKVEHSQKTYLGHLVNLYRLMEAEGCSDEACRAGMFHSIYGTELFQGFKLPLESRAKVRELIGERPEWIAYLNCAMDRASFDEAALGNGETYRFIDRLTKQPVEMKRADFDYLCRVHLYDWLEQAPRSRHGWDYRRAGYRRLAERLGPKAQAAYDRVFATEAGKS